MKFKQGISPNQEVLIPKKASDFLPEDHLAKIIYLIVDKLDIFPIINKYSKMGQNAYNPRMLIRLLFYHYSIGICSSRKISKSCYERLDTRYLSDGLQPSHDRISDFRKDNLEDLKDLFSQIVLIGFELGLINMTNINTSIDGSKLKANASGKLSKTEEQFAKLLEKTNEEISLLLKKAEEADIKESELLNKSKISKKLKSKISRKAAIEKAIQKVKQKKELLQHNLMEHRRKNVKPPELSKTELNRINNQKINTTDNEANFMKQRNGLIKPAYNCQVSVDEKEQFILANNVTMDCNDQHQLILMIQKTIKNIGCMPKSVKGDNGYYPELDLAIRFFPEINLFIDDKNRRNKEIDINKLQKKYSKEELWNLFKLLSKEGEEEYKKRMFTVEPIFGNLKENSGIKTFLLRGIFDVKGEFNLMCIGHNLKKIVNFISKNNIPIALAMQKIQKKQQICENIALKLICSIKNAKIFLAKFI